MGAMSDLDDDDDDDDILITGVRDEGGTPMPPPTLRGVDDARHDCSDVDADEGDETHQTNFERIRPNPPVRDIAHRLLRLVDGIPIGTDDTLIMERVEQQQ
eukprot:2852525-Pyramimonas_sp.AAC.1